eukprot:gnl/Chilomastix_cuspidata/1479.p1 GENE.gnl/Chilomastix_cuspidata/1479~~gnl/Chilomastix_cuspidata/1479.p1  ORF type:complete len:2502 (+),score=265.48 gnl/Chilomastix_cuspidata/1479:56-7561(+)
MVALFIVLILFSLADLSTTIPPGIEAAIRPFDKPILFDSCDEEENDFILYRHQAKLTTLENSVHLGNPAIVPWGYDQTSDDHGNDSRARKFIFNNLETQSSLTLFYPYDFTATSVNTSYSSEPEDSHEFSEGAFLRIDGPDELPLPYESYFHWLDALDGVDVTRGSALFSKSVATLQVLAPFDPETYEIVGSSDHYLDLTWDSDGFCSAFSSVSSSFSNCYANYSSLVDAVGELDADNSDVYFSFLTPDDIRGGALLDDNELPRFGVLFIPDLYQGLEQYIADRLGSSGAAAIEAFVSAGGVLYATAKGASLVDLLVDKDEGSALLERPSGESTFFDYSRLLVSPSSTVAKLSGCERSLFAEELLDASVDSSGVYDNHILRTLCYALARDSELFSSYSTFLSTYLPFDSAEAASGLTRIQTLTQTTALKYRDSETADDTDLEADTDIPALLHKRHGLGHVIICLHSPSQSKHGHYHLHNAYILAAQQPVLVSVTIDGANITLIDSFTELSGSQLIIPALEVVSLGVNLTVINLGSDTVDENGTNGICSEEDFGVLIFAVNGIDLVLDDDNDGACAEVQLSSLDLIDEIPVSSINVSAPVIQCCVGNPLTPLEPLSLFVTASVVDPLATQAGTNVPIMYYLARYSSRSRGNKFSSFVTVRSAEAARIEATFNPDPSVYYPVKGRGQYIDAPLHVENKAATTAYEVTTTQTYILISPVVDGSDRQFIAQASVFDHEYFFSDVNSLEMDYTIDWLQSEPEDRGFEEHRDAICYQDLATRGDYLAADWDTPARLHRADISDYNLSYIEGVVSDVKNAAYSAYVDDRSVLEQQYFPNCDAAFEHAAQRLVPFYDPSTQLGADLRWGTDRSNIPAQNYSATNDAGRVRLLFVRNDLYFYSHAIYPLPGNIDTGGETNYVFTVDRLYTESIDDWKSGYGRNSQMYSGSEGAYDRENGLITSVWENEILLNPDVVIVPFLLEDEGGGDAFSGDSRFVTELPDGFTAARTYSIFPIRSDQRVKTAGDIWEFDADTHRHLTYQELVFAKPLTLSFVVPTELGKRGGIVKIYLPVDISSRIEAFDYYPYNEMSHISVSADQIAVFESGYDAGSGLTCVYFKYTRGMLPNESDGKDLELTIYILICDDDDSDVEVTSIVVYEMDYVLGSDDGGMSFKDEGTEIEGSFTFTASPALIVPSINVEFTRIAAPELEASDEDEEQSIINAYELVEPLTRTGCYIQELLHRPIHSSAEIHTNKRPLVSESGCFSTYMIAGISSVPFREYVNTGISLNTPATPVTSRVSWKDIWGRQFHQPLRTIVPDVPPIPPPVRSFSLSSAFEIFSLGGEVLDHWPSDESVDLHVTLKVRNGFPKFFEITHCEDSRLFHLCDGRGCPDYSTHIQIDSESNEPLIDPSVYPLSEEQNATRLSGNLFASPSTHSARYGICYSEAPAYTSGLLMSDEVMGMLKDVDAGLLTLCASDDDSSDCQNLPDEVEGISARPSSDETEADFDDPSTLWNYATVVDTYYPTNYISDTTMWDITHWDYADSAFEKAYPYHMDDWIPNIGNALTHPHNLLYYAMFKGLGFNIKYDKARSNPGLKNGEVSGWYSENLQNKDHTLLAGQATSNLFGYAGADPLITVDDFVELSELEGDGVSDIVASTLSNMNICLFNRWFLKSDIAEDAFAFPFNVVVNNVIPIDPTLDKDDARLTSYECEDVFYVPENISMAENFLETATSRDYLYFSMNVRGEAREDVHVITRLEPLSTGYPYNGDAKIFEGGRLTYWVPGTGPNCYQTITSPAVVVPAYVNVLDLAGSLVSSSTPTFDSSVYLHLKVSDPLQPIAFAQDSTVTYRGFGDVMISTYTGGWNGYSAMITEDGQSTIVRVEIYNLAGYDIEMLVGAIDWEDEELEAINAYDLMNNHLSVVRAPTAFHFLEPNIPSELEGYVEFVPFQFVAGVASQFFDFPNTHVTTIKDGWKGTYFYKVTFTSIPENLVGQVVEIPFVLNAEYFDNFPGSENDARGEEFVGAYELKPPSMRFAYPYPDDHILAGLAYYSPTDPARDLQISTHIPERFSVLGAIIVSDEELEEMTVLSSESDSYTQMDEYWEELTSEDNDVLSFTGRSRALGLDETEINAGTEYAFSFDSAIPSLPYTLADSDFPQRSYVNVLVRLFANYVPNGWNAAHTLSRGSFADWKDDMKSTESSVGALNVQAKGAWMRMTYQVSLRDLEDPYNTEYEYIPAQTSMYARVNVILTNIGDSTAYNSNATLVVRANNEFMPILDENMNEEGVEVTVGVANGTHYNVTLNANENLTPGLARAIKVWFVCPPMELYEDTVLSTAAHRVPRGGLPQLLGISVGIDENNITKPPLRSFELISESEVALDLTASAGERRVSQPLMETSSVPYEELTEVLPVQSPWLSWWALALYALLLLVAIGVPVLLLARRRGKRGLLHASPPQPPVQPAQIDLVNVHGEWNNRLHFAAAPRAELPPPPPPPLSPPLSPSGDGVFGFLSVRAP